MLMSAYAALSSGPMTYRGLHWDDGYDLGIKTGPVGAELFEQLAQAFGGPSDAKRIDPRRGNASSGRRFPYPGWQDETTGSASHCSEGALTLIGACRNKLVFPAILQSRRRPMQKASAYGASVSPPRGPSEVALPHYCGRSQPLMVPASMPQSRPSGQGKRAPLRELSSHRD